MNAKHRRRLAHSLRKEWFAHIKVGNICTGKDWLTPTNDAGLRFIWKKLNPAARYINSELEKFI